MRLSDNGSAKKKCRFFAFVSERREKIFKKNIYRKNLIDKNVINIENIKNLNKIFMSRIIIKFLSESAKNEIEINEKRILEIIKIIKSKKSNIKWIFF